jgi:hypothetical protein
MSSKINLNDIYDKNINFLIGSGASYGLFPTLSVKVKGPNGEPQTIETLAGIFSNDNKRTLEALLFMHYYKVCIKPILEFNFQDPAMSAEKKKVISNYETFLRTIITILQRRKNNDKKCNIFTTNYDGCFAHTADDLLRAGEVDFIINDGTRGFTRRYLQAKNFNNLVYQTGVFDRHRSDVPQINLIHLHGCAYWKKENDTILVSYPTGHPNVPIDASISAQLTSFSTTLGDDTKRIGDIAAPTISTDITSAFWDKYKQLPIVNPTKWKFHETVFEEHYYQMLRLLSYELEKPNSIFIIFGFSFADEHILNLVKRSLSNPELQVFICCFDQSEFKRIENIFKSFKNVSYILNDSDLDFSVFNQDVFCIEAENENTLEQPPQDEDVPGALDAADDEGIGE